MMTSGLFRKQVGKGLANEMRLLGFRGSGLEYVTVTDEFLFGVYIDLTGWGGHCSLGAGIHPRIITRNSEGPINLEKLKPFQYEFPISPWSISAEKIWTYSESKEENMNIIMEMLSVIRTQLLPLFELFKSEPNFLDTFEVADLENFHDRFFELTGTFILTSETRFAWAMALYQEHKNIEKAKLFARYLISYGDSGSLFFGLDDMRRILSTP